MDKDIRISEGLPFALRWQAAEIYYAAFRQKARAFLGPRQAALSLLHRGFQAAQVLVAYRGSDLVGLAGIQHNRRLFVDVHLESFVQEYGLLPALPRFALSWLFFRPYTHPGLLLDGIAVDEKARGRGVGTRLVQAVIDFARRHGYPSVRLEVVDTNPRARSLYERLGFVAKASHRYPFTLNWIGFSGSTTMVYTVEPG